MVYNHHHHSGHFKSIAPYLTDKGEHTALYKINDTMAASAVGTFNVRADVDACDCTRGLYGHRETTESALKVN